MHGSPARRRRSSSTDDSASWFIDSDYDQERFFVRDASLTGADEPYEKLQRAFKAEIDEDAWASLYSTVSRPFEPPSTGKIAVKVINHFGDEVLKAYACRTTTDGSAMVSCVTRPTASAYTGLHGPQNPS